VNKIYLILCLHNHQPVGNFDHVFESHFADAYVPFLDTYERYAEMPMGLHCSGPLWDWVGERRPDYIERVRKLADKGALEMLAGAYYEPILSMIPEPDRIGQIEMMRDFIRETFHQDARGFWLAERVWEQEMTSSLARAGIRYTIVDDSHLKNAGILDERLLGYYLTEDHGGLVALFATNERLRYLIPFREPEETRQYLQDIAGRHPGSLLVYGDDGEKFGGWPGTHDWVYTRGWLDRFFGMLRDNREWIELITPSQALDMMQPLGKIYIPDSSYREMMEWALPVNAGLRYERMINALNNQDAWNDAAPFIRGGFWRNFKYKYPEANQMYARMLEVSGRLNRTGKKDAGEARRRLYMAQCNCPYWHGVFGGLYLNHLRFETYRNLIRADVLLNSAEKKNTPAITAEEADYDLDGRNEIVLQNRWHRLYFQPHRGGRLYEWDFFPARTNLLDTLSRRPEAYHAAIHEAPEQKNKGESQSIHDLWKLQDPGIREYLIYDPYERKSFLDHIITGEISADRLRRNEITEHGPLPLQAYVPRLKKSKDSCRLTLTRTGELDIGGLSLPVTIKKAITVSAADAALRCAYEITNGGGAALNCRFGMEWNFAMLAGNADDRYYFCGGKSPAGNLSAELEKKNVRRFGLADEWQGITVTFAYSEPVALFTFPVETVSQSESAYERVYQSSVVYPVIDLRLAPGEKKKFSFTLKVEHTA